MLECSNCFYYGNYRDAFSHIYLHKVVNNSFYFRVKDLKRDYNIFIEGKDLLAMQKYDTEFTCLSNYSFVSDLFLSYNKAIAKAKLVSNSPYFYMLTEDDLFKCITDKEYTSIALMIFKDGKSLDNVYNSFINTFSDEFSIKRYYSYDTLIDESNDDRRKVYSYSNQLIKIAESVLSDGDTIYALDIAYSSSKLIEGVSKKLSLSNLISIIENDRVEDLGVPILKR